MPAIEPFYEIGTDHAKRIDSAGDQERTARKAEICCGAITTATTTRR
jgi:hypothetical protein